MATPAVKAIIRHIWDAIINADAHSLSFLVREISMDMREPVPIIEGTAFQTEFFQDDEGHRLPVLHAVIQGLVQWRLDWTERDCASMLTVLRDLGAEPDAPAPLGLTPLRIAMDEAQVRSCFLVHKRQPLTNKSHRTEPTLHTSSSGSWGQIPTIQ